MKKSARYKQCEIARNELREVCWLPEEFARTGKYIKIKKDGIWHNGWQVAIVYNNPVEDIAAFYYNARDAFPSLDSYLKTKFQEVRKDDQS